MKRPKIYKILNKQIYIARYFIVYEAPWETHEINQRGPLIKEVKLPCFSKAERDVLFQDAVNNGFEPWVEDIEQSEFYYLENIQFDSEEDAGLCIAIGLEAFRKRKCNIAKE